MSQFELEGVVRIIRQENLHRVTLYNKFREAHGGVFDGVNLPSAPWRIDKKSARDFMDNIFPERSQPLDNPRYNKIERASLQEHLKLARQNNLFICKQYFQFIKKSKDRRYYTAPWVHFHIAVRDFFKMAHPDYDERFSVHCCKLLSITPKEHVRICIRECLTNSRKWRRFYLTNREKMEILSRPWDRFHLSEAQFFDAVRANDMEIFKNDTP